MWIASFRERYIDFRSCWVVFIHIVWGHPGGTLQFSKGEAVKICLASDSSGIHGVWPNRERRCAWTVAERCGCSVFYLASFCTWWYHLIPKSLRRHHWLRASILCTSLLVPSARNRTGRWVECKYYTTSTWWKWRFVTSISDSPGSAQLHEW